MNGNVVKTNGNATMHKRASVVSGDPHGMQQQLQQSDKSKMADMDGGDMSIADSGKTDVVELKREVGLSGGISFIVGGIIGK